MGKTLEYHWKLWENIGKSWNISVKKHGNITGKYVETLGKASEHHGEIQETHWKLIGTYLFTITTSPQILDAGFDRNIIEPNGNNIMDVEIPFGNMIVLFPINHLMDIEIPFSNHFPITSSNGNTII